QGVHGADGEEQEPDAPGDEAEIDAAEDRVAAAVVVAPSAEQILAVDGDANRPERHERERERRRGKRDHVTRAEPGSLAAQPPRGAEEEPAAEPVDGGRVDP